MSDQVTHLYLLKEEAREAARDRADLRRTFYPSLTPQIICNVLTGSIYPFTRRTTVNQTIFCQDEKEEWVTSIPVKKAFYLIKSYGERHGGVPSEKYYTDEEIATICQARRRIDVLAGLTPIEKVYTVETPFTGVLKREEYLKIIEELQREMSMTKARSFWRNPSANPHIPHQLK